MNINFETNIKILLSDFFKNADGKHSKKILFASVPADGHVNPLLPIAQHLVKQGYDIRWYTSENYATKIQSCGVHHYTLKHAMDISGKGPDELFPNRKLIKQQVKKLVFDIMHAFVLRAPEYYEDIMQIHQEFLFDIVIADCLFFAITFIRHHLNVTVISVGVAPLMESSKDIAPAGLGMLPPKNIFQKLQCKVLQRIIAAMFKKPIQLMQALIKQYGIDMNINNMFDYIINQSSLLLQLGTPGFGSNRFFNCMLLT